MAKGKVLVVGAGIGGLCTAWGLVRRGFAVEVFEQGSIPNPRSSSYDEHRITRHAYGDFAGYARLMPEAFRVYDELFAEIGATHFDPLPLLVIQREEIGWFTKSMGSMDELAVPYRDVPVRELAGRYPMLDPEGVTAAFECEGAGVLFPIRILTDLVVHLAGRGVVFHPNTKVEAVDPERGALTVGAQVHAGDAVVVAAGAWAGRLVPSLAGLAVPSRQIVLYVAPPPGLHAAWRDAPAIIDLGERSGTYTLPPRPGTRLKVGDHHFTRLGDPDDDRVATEVDTVRLLAAARLAYRDFDRYAVLERKVCYYTVTEDEGFLVEPIGAAGYLQSACSGHGFKLAALIGDGLARAISGEMRKDDLPGWAAGKAALAA
ncbi:NAD(P)/FAD-dependent oxidoreductase [Aureimonas psammosilenae]|uniref:NAD(P)/FAD-dependent oxidoreductase n=1 Tax=Aureimonas psammosilenae TaxID=2495496 RepID=UPI001260C6CF|nr:FAD-dependent oxidoreductase [Aureimonas psammosilenae]